MVGFRVDVYRVTVRFCVGFVKVSLEVEGEIQEVNNFEIGFNCNF